MDKRRGLGALIGAAILTFAAVGAVSATAVSPVLGIAKSVDQPTLFGGGTVTYSITVTATTGTFHQVIVTDANCDAQTLAWFSGTGSSTAGPSGNGAAGFLHEGDSWVFHCTRALTDPGTYHNTASADGCVDGSVDGCNQGSHAGSGSSNDAVVVVEAATEAPPTEQPTSGGNNSSNIPTQAPTDVAGQTTSAPSDTAWLLIVALAVLFSSLFVLRPARGTKPRS